jgi:hypothetical protein
MNYLKIYCNLIRKAENRTLPEGYTEKHHTFPKSIFGKNNRIVVLTAREHYIAHALLEKIYIQRYGLKDKKTIKMTYAHIMMKNNGYFNSYLYESVKIRMSKSNRGKNNPFFGKKHSDETKEKLRIARTGKKLSPEMVEKIRIKNIGEKNHFYGKKHSKEAKIKMGELKKGNKNALGYKMTEEQIEKRRRKMIGRKHSEEHKQKLSQSISGRRWWNNGIETKMSFDCPGDGWVLGRAKEIKGRKWWTDGNITKMSVECPGDEWSVGRLKLQK